jgi:hypothetical protein
MTTRGITVDHEDTVHAGRGRQLLVYGLAAFLVVLTVTYRVLTMGGSLGGFENDQFVTLSQAQQLAMGDWPVRDFVDLGKPLTVLLSALGQLLIGRTLFAEALVTSALIGVSTAIMFVMSWRATGSILIPLIIALLQIAMAPRFYNYSKLLAYAIATPALWWYIDRPDRTRLCVVGAAAVIAGLLRHDHGLYVGLTAIVAVILVRRPNVRGIYTDLACLGTFVGVVTLPYLLFLQLNGGIVHYARSFIAYAGETAERTNLHSLSPSIDWSQPWLVRVPQPHPQPRVKVRWAARTSTKERAEHERALGLTEPEPLPDDVITYALADISAAHLRAIVKDPAVADTYGIDRDRFVLNDPYYTRVPTTRERILASLGRLRILPGVLNGDNAVPFLFALMYVVPIASLLLVVRSRRATAGVSTARSSIKIMVVVVMALLVDRAFLRGNLPSRLADVTEPVGILAAWVAVSLLSLQSRGWRTAAALVLLVVLALTTLSIQALEDVAGQAAQLGGTATELRERAKNVRTLLSAVPPVAAWPADATGIEAVAHYVNACTKPDDRVLAVGYISELFFMAQRRFAAGHVWILPRFFDADVDQRLMVDRIRRFRVPLVLTVADPEYTDDYIPSFTRLTGFLATEYRLIDTIDFGRGFRFRVLARHDLTPTGMYGLSRLPCFS